MKVFISCVLGMSSRSRGTGVQDPDISVSVIGRAARADLNAEMRAGVIIRSPDVSEERRGLGESDEKGAEVAGSVDAKVRRRLGSVTRRRTETL